MYLSGDIGGTKTHLALYQEDGTQVKDEKFPSKEHKDLKTIVQKFLQSNDEHIDRACFGIAGPVKDGVCRATNLPWVIDAKELEKELQIESVALLNDLESNAYGLKVLGKEEFFILNEGDPQAIGNQAMVSAGTGLGEAGIYFDGTDHFPFACEGGHCDFAPRNDLEIELFHYLNKKFGHVSYERMLSGPGLYNLYRFLVDTKKEKGDDEIEKSEAKEGPRFITSKALKKESSVCERVVKWFISLYAAEAGNAALKFMAYGGVFLGGGIAPKILNLFDKKEFLSAFIDKGRFKDFLNAIPVKVVLNENTALLGSMYYAKKMKRS